VKFHDDRPANVFKITKYTYTDDSVRVYWLNGADELVMAFAEFNGNKTAMAQQENDDKPRRGFPSLLILHHVGSGGTYLFLEVWPARQAKNAAAVCWRSSPLLNLRGGCFGGSETDGILPLISSTPCRRIRSRVAIRDQFIRPIKHFLSARALHSKAAGQCRKPETPSPKLLYTRASRLGTL